MAGPHIRPPGRILVIVCSCNVLSDCQIRSTVDAEAGGARTPGQVYRCLGCSPQCGRCARTIRSILDQALGACAVDCSTCPAHAVMDRLEASSARPLPAGRPVSQPTPFFLDAAE